METKRLSFRRHSNLSARLIKNYKNILYSLRVQATYFNCKSIDRM